MRARRYLPAGAYTRALAALDHRSCTPSCARPTTSNIALGEWGYLGDATLTAAILDRLAMHAIRIDIAGLSFRQHVAKSRAERAPAT